MANENARAGLSTNSCACSAGSEAALRHRGGEVGEQPGHAGRAAVDRPVAPAGGVHAQRDPVAEAVLERPRRAGERAVLAAGRPAEALVVLDHRARREDLALVAAVDDLVGVGQDDVPGRTPRSTRNARLGGPAVPPSQWVRIGHARARRGRPRPRRTPSPRPRVRPVGVAGDLDDAGAVGRPLDDRSGVVVGVDPVVDVGGEEGGDLVGGKEHAPVAVVVVALVVEPGGGDDVDAAAPADLGQLGDVAAAVGGHRVDDRAQAERLGRGQLGDRGLDRVEAEVREQLTGRPPSMTRCSWA